MPTINVRGAKHTYATCPICGADVLRDALAWQTHMEAEHSADDSTWTDTGLRGGFSGLRDLPSKVYEYAHKCYGCGATFSTEAALETHLSDVHSAT